MASRRKTREFVLQVLFAADVQQRDPWLVYDVIREHCATDEDPPCQLDRVMDDFARELVQVVSREAATIDNLIGELSHHWKLHRMYLVDRNVLRMAVAEILHFSDIPPRVTLNEAIELGRKYGTENSPSFINGILDRFTDLKDDPSLSSDAAEILARLDETATTS